MRRLNTARKLAAAASTIAALFSASAMATTTQVVFKNSTVDGTTPNSELIPDSKGNLYGTAQYGGKLNKGVLFELVKPAAKNGAWKTIVLHNFGGTLPNGSKKPLTDGARSSPVFAGKVVEGSGVLVW